MTLNGPLTLNSEQFSPYRADGKLYGFVCVVIGATQPVGKAITLELAAHGAACVYACSDKSSREYDQLAQEIKSEFPNTQVIGYPYKLANEEDTLALIDDVLNSCKLLLLYKYRVPWRSILEYQPAGDSKLYKKR
jgi:hypothetical protein